MAANATSQSSALERPGPSPNPAALGSIRRVALVSHNYNVLDTRGFYDYSEHFARINRLCDARGCDTILYALYTWDRDSPTSRDAESCFAEMAHVNRVILEVGSPESENFDHVEILQRGDREPRKVRQHFAASGDSGSRKSMFIEELDERTFGDALLVLCGETNIASTQRGTAEMSDPHNFVGRLRSMGIRLILNPIHDYMRRPEMREKRRRYSRAGATVVSVWNMGFDT